ncbi:MAG: hypothetical protein HRU09_10235 [Oligoflexales bacterium]|nr:hypothetical protein [Oligoflexales bacterium]
MALHLRCQTPKAVFLFGIPVGKLLHFPNHHRYMPGIHFDVDPSKPINLQLIAAVEKELGEAVNGKDIHIYQEFCEPLKADEQAEEFSLYTGFSEKPRQVPLLHWKPLPYLLRNMEKNRMRLAYLKAWQVQTGALGLTTKAVEMDAEELKRNSSLLDPQ